MGRAVIRKNTLRIKCSWLAGPLYTSKLLAGPSPPLFLQCPLSFVLYLGHGIVDRVALSCFSNSAHGSGVRARQGDGRGGRGGGVSRLGPRFAVVRGHSHKQPPPFLFCGIQLSCCFDFVDMNPHWNMVSYYNTLHKNNHLR